MTTSLAHVLIVEDDEEIATLVAKYLSANEYRVTASKDGGDQHRAPGLSPRKYMDSILRRESSCG